MKQATLILALLGAILLAACGSNIHTSQSTFNNGSGDQPFKPTTHLLHRAVVSNYFAGQLQVFDTVQNQLTAFAFGAGLQPTFLQSSPDGTLTFVYNSGANTISSLNNNLEAVKATIQLSGFTDSFVTSTDNKFGFAAVYNYSNGTFRTPGAIVRFNPTDGSLNTQIPFANVRYIAMDPAQKHLLALTSVSNEPNNPHWVDLSVDDPVTQVPPIYSLTLSGNAIPLSNPVASFFSADNTKAFILSCGAECGGTTSATVTEIDISSLVLNINALSPGEVSDNVIHTGTVNVVKQWVVSGARRGFIDTTANKLYVAGSTTTLTDSGGNVVQDGFFTTIDLTAGTASAPIPTGPGAKRWIRNINGVFWVASTGCGVQSCITMVNPATNAATILPTAKGDATGVSLIANSGQVYTVEGGEVYIYDQKGNPITSGFATDVKGQAYDVLYIN